MGRLTENLDSITDKIRASFEAKDAAREKVLPICREVIRLAAFPSALYIARNWTRLRSC